MLGVYPDSPDVAELERPSNWFTWHAHRIRNGGRVLDVACGSGRHAIAAAALGAKVVAVDVDPAGLEAGRREAKNRNLAVEFLQADLTGAWPELGTFDMVLVFNYLDRDRMPRLIETVAPGGFLLLETFLEAQKAFGWGPENDAHLLRSGELQKLVAPLTVLHGREVVEPVDNSRWSALASVLAQRK